VLVGDDRTAAPEGSWTEISQRRLVSLCLTLPRSRRQFVEASPHIWWMKVGKVNVLAKKHESFYPFFHLFILSAKVSWGLYHTYFPPYSSEPEPDWWKTTGMVPED